MSDATKIPSRAETEEYCDRDRRYEPIRVTDRTAPVPDGKYEGREGRVIVITQARDDDYRGLKAGEEIEMIVYFRDDGKRTRCFTGEFLERVRAHRRS